MSSEGKKSMYRLYEKINSIVELSNEKQRDSVKVISDIDCGIIKVYGQDADILKRASSWRIDEMRTAIDKIAPT
jgi:hypothetical protein